jgi:hypothetical protein
MSFRCIVIPHIRLLSGKSLLYFLCRTNTSYDQRCLRTSVSPFLVSDSILGVSRSTWMIDT